MSWKAGFGLGLRGLGDSLMQWAMHRSNQQDRAMERALQMQGRETAEKAQQAQADYYAGMNADRVADNELREAEFVMKNFAGQEVGPEVTSQIAERFRPLVLQQDSKMTSAPAPEDLPVPADSFEQLKTVTSIRPQSATAGERIAQTNLASRERADALRMDYLTRKLGQDKELAQMANSRGYAQIDAMLRATAQRVAATMSGQDAAMERAMYAAEADALLEQWKAENKTQNPMLQILMGQQPGAVPGAAPAAPAPKPPVPTPTRPTKVGGPQAVSDPNDPLGLGIKRRP